MSTALSPNNAGQQHPRRRLSKAMSLTELSARTLGADPRTFERIYRNHLVRLSRCLWQIDLNVLDEDMRRGLDDPAPPARFRQRIRKPR